MIDGTDSRPLNPAQRLRVEIHGAVQGVGFRPYVYRLARELGLTGWVINDTQGVFIEVEGTEAQLSRFAERLPREVPPLAIIHSVTSQLLPGEGFEGFEIRSSNASGGKTVFMLPDVGTCHDCLHEIYDRKDRRYRYPFTNCTNCGPRYSIIKELPYDRPNTTMQTFRMCEQCQGEYDQPADRRFHAQPNACPACGPTMTYLAQVEGDEGLSGTGTPRARFALGAEGDPALDMAVKALRQGLIVAVKGLGGFHLMCDARNERVIERLRQRKPRPTKPLAVMARDLGQAETLVHLDPDAQSLLLSAQAPILILPARHDTPIAANIAPSNPNLGVMLPYTPLHHLLLQELDFPVVATSGNLSDEPICIDNEEAILRLGHVADAFLVHNRPIERHVDDSIAWFVEGIPQLLRRARGFAPLPVSLDQKIPNILAVGAHLKNTIALSVDDQVFISQHIGDLETLESWRAFNRVIDDFIRVYETQPQAIAHDLHPDYLSTTWATSPERVGQFGSQSLHLVPVQHHHAHLASVLAENQWHGPALGVIWDGTGYGLDGTIWGGEFLIGDARSFRRVAHLREFSLPGGDAVIKEPYRVALSLLWELQGENAWQREDLAPVRALQGGQGRILSQMLEKGVNTPRTTSMGRLFDGVAALLGVHLTASFEAEAAMALEFLANPAEDGAYPFPIIRQPGGGETPLQLDWQPLLDGILDDLKGRVELPVISARFHNSLAEGIVRIALEVGEPTIALSGGVFQNRYLTEKVLSHLRKAGFEVILHRLVPPNDGGISLGQVAVAAAQITT